jgi:hypothetical protein
MTKKISDLKSVLGFIDVGKEYCLLMENRHSKTKVKLIQEAFVIMPQLCLYGMRLPDIKKASDYESPEISHEEWNELFISLKGKLKGWDYYKEMFDPYQLKDKKPVNASLSDDFSDIYRDIKPGLNDWEKAIATERLGIIWYWKWGFENHWGEHATGAFRALYSLLYSHVEDKYGDYIGIKNNSLKVHSK